METSELNKLVWLINVSDKLGRIQPRNVKLTYVSLISFEVLNNKMHAIKKNIFTTCNK